MDYLSVKGGGGDWSNYNLISPNSATRDEIPDYQIGKCVQLLSQCCNQSPLIFKIQKPNRESHKMINRYQPTIITNHNCTTAESLLGGRGVVDCQHNFWVHKLLTTKDTTRRAMIWSNFQTYAAPSLACCTHRNYVLLHIVSDTIILRIFHLSL